MRQEKGRRQVLAARPVVKGHAVAPPQRSSLPARIVRSNIACAAKGEITLSRNPAAALPVYALVNAAPLARCPGIGRKSPIPCGGRAGTRTQNPLIKSSRPPGFSRSHPGDHLRLTVAVQGGYK